MPRHILYILIIGGFIFILSILFLLFCFVRGSGMHDKKDDDMEQEKALQETRKKETIY